VGVIESGIAPAWNTPAKSNAVQTLSEEPPTRKSFCGTAPAFDRASRAIVCRGGDVRVQRH